MPFQPIDTSMDHDNELAHQIKAQLQIRLGNQLRDFRVTTLEHGLVLQGRIHSYYGKLVIQQVAMDVSGFGIAANEITVF